MLFAADNPTLAFETLATLGESLGLFRMLAHGTGASDDFASFGAFEIDNVVLIEVGAEGRQQWIEFFAPDRLGDAIDRLYERFAAQLPEGAARTRATTAARSLAAALERYDVERFATALAPTVVGVDHRRGGCMAPAGSKPPRCCRSCGSSRKPPTSSSAEPTPS